MDKVALLIGLALVALGVGGFAASGMAAKTALIPAYAGILLAALGLLVAAKPSARKHAMHAAATIALLGFLASTGKLITGLTHGHPSPLALFSQIGMSLLCILFVLLAIRSFIAARRSR